MLARDVDGVKGATHFPSCLGQPPPKLAPEAAQTEQKSEKFFFANFPSFFSFPVSVSSASAVAAHSLKRAKNRELSFFASVSVSSQASDKKSCFARKLIKLLRSSHFLF